MKIYDIIKKVNFCLVSKSLKNSFIAGTFMQKFNFRL